MNQKDDKAAKNEEEESNDKEKDQDNEIKIEAQNKLHTILIASIFTLFFTAQTVIYP